MKYRMIIEENGKFYVPQYNHKFWPFWFNFTYNYPYRYAYIKTRRSFTDSDEAYEFIREQQNKTDEPIIVNL